MKMRSYVIGFVLSLTLTLVTYFMVTGKVYSNSHAAILIIVLALVQLFVQVIFFLHLNRDSRPRWNIIVFAFTLMVVVILVVGSLWIMNNLNYNGDPNNTPQINKYLHGQDSL